MSGGSRDPGVADDVIVVLGMLPPPVTGAAKNTLLLLEELRARGRRVIGISTAAGAMAFNRSAAYHLRRIARFLANAWRVATLPRVGTFYMVPDGGAGLWYTAAYLLLARRRAARIFIHHRSFGYIDKAAPQMTWICAAPREDIVHIFLSEGMRDRFESRYGRRRALICDNARYVEGGADAKRDDVLVVGHLSNLSFDKGFEEVVNTFEQIVARGIPARLLLAGPIKEQRVADLLEEVSDRHAGMIEYHGALSGDAKSAFYRSLHLFLFPTKWAQEAQPNVIYEAFAGGALVAAFDRGCISEMVAEQQGLVVPRDADFASAAADYAERLWQGKTDWNGVAQALVADMRRKASLAREQHRTLLAALEGGQP